MKQIIAVKANIVEQGTNMRNFDTAAAWLNTNPRFRPSVNGRTVSERFKVRIKALIHMCNADRQLLGLCRTNSGNAKNLPGYEAANVGHCGAKNITEQARNI